MAKRHSDVGRFVANFTRPPSEGEDIWWLYCIDTDTKLLPSFISKLATVFIENGNYILEIERICAEQGTVSDDGDNWVDKYSGYTITSIAFNNEEGYTESGFKVKSRELLEEERGNAIIQTAKSKHNMKIKRRKKYSMSQTQWENIRVLISLLYMSLLLLNLLI